MSEHAAVQIDFMPNPASVALKHGDLKAQKVKGYKRGYDAEMVVRFRNAIDKRLAGYRPNSDQQHPFGYLMLELGLLVGARPGEIARLRLEWLRGNAFVVGTRGSSLGVGTESPLRSATRASWTRSEPVRRSSGQATFFE